MDHISQDGITRMINQLDDSTKQIIAAAGFGMVGKIAYDNLSPEQKEKIVRCLRSVKDCASHVLTQIGETAALAIGGAGGGVNAAFPEQNRGIYHNTQYRNSDIELQLGLESRSPRLQNALENNRNTNQRGYQR